jgi:hypothetical protein
MAAPEVPPTRARMIAAALAVLALGVALWWWIELRSAPPPPPPVTLPAP